jgi:hypothetical protein
VDTQSKLDVAKAHDLDPDLLQKVVTGCIDSSNYQQLCQDKKWQAARQQEDESRPAPSNGIKAHKSKGGPGRTTPPANLPHVSSCTFLPQAQAQAQGTLQRGAGTGNGIQGAPETASASGAGRAPQWSDSLLPEAWCAMAEEVVNKYHVDADTCR